MIHSQLKLSTSNKNKIQEFNRFGLSFDIIQGIDVKEVQGSIDEVIIYKTLNFPELTIVEDTVLSVNGNEVVDIRWRVKELSQMQDPIIQWTVSLGLVDHDFLYIYRGIIDCDFIKQQSDFIPKDSFGFDSFLKPKNIDLSFYELEQQGKKDLFSPRKIAVDNLLKGDYYKKIPISSIKCWEGSYQNS